MCCCIPRVGIPGVGITLSKPPPPESGRGREEVFKGGGRRGLRHEIIKCIFGGQQIHLGSNPSLPVTSDILTSARSSLKREFSCGAVRSAEDWWHSPVQCVYSATERGP